MRRTTTAIAIALLWAPANQAFVQNQVSTSSSRKQVVSQSAVHDSVTALQVTPDASSINLNDNFNDWEGLDKKNASRKKFGLKPMTPEQYTENEGLVQQMALEQNHRAVQASNERKQQQAREAAQASANFVPGFLEKMMSNVLPDTCESNFDCEAPKVCCDFGAAKVCCSGGSRQRSREGEMMLVPVPIDVSPEGWSSNY